MTSKLTLPARTFGLDEWSWYARTRGVSLVELARRTGTPVSTVYAYSCKARRAPSAWVRRAWAELGYTVTPPGGAGDPPTPSSPGGVIT